MKPPRPSPRLRVLVFMLVNLVAMVNLGLLLGRHLGWGLMGLFGLATAEGGAAVWVTPGISRLGRVSYLFLAGLILGSLFPWPGNMVSQEIGFGPALVILAATLIVVGPGWLETFQRHP
jgi:hypothetical protein